MSYFFPNIPSLRDIEYSLQRSRRLINESMQLSQKSLSRLTDHSTCNKCHICSTGNCSKLSSYSSQYQKGYDKSTNSLLTYTPFKASISKYPANNSLRSENELLNQENIMLLERLKDLHCEINYLSEKKNESSLATDKNIGSRIALLEEKINELEDIYQNNLDSYQIPIIVSENSQRIQEKIDKTDEKYQDLQKKIDRAERILKQKQIKEKKEKKHKDTHCKNCIPTRYSS